uniref:Uncharacterized protein n=1 Tax=Phyllostachys edulis TaxID=38705 RepID=D3IVC3_PHYED|nr:hypothetical protein [Phyllostachys edulis]
MQCFWSPPRPPHSTWHTRQRHRLGTASGGARPAAAAADDRSACCAAPRSSGPAAWSSSARSGSITVVVTVIRSVTDPKFRTIKPFYNHLECLQANGSKKQPRGQKFTSGHHNHWQSHDRYSLPVPLMLASWNPSPGEHALMTRFGIYNGRCNADWSDDKDLKLPLIQLISVLNRKAEWPKRPPEVLDDLFEDLLGGPDFKNDLFKIQKTTLLQYFEQPERS